MSLFFFDPNPVASSLKDNLDIMKIDLWCTQNYVFISSATVVQKLQVEQDRHRQID